MSAGPPDRALQENKDEWIESEVTMRRKKLKRHPAVHKVYGRLIHSSRTGDTDQGIEAMRQMISMKAKQSDQSYMLMLNLCVKTPVPWDIVTEVLGYMEKDNVVLVESGYTALIKMHVRETDFIPAVELLEKMIQSPSTMPKRRTLLPLLQSVARAGDMENLKKVLWTYRKVQIELGQEEFTSLISICTMHGDRHMMANVLEDM